MPDDKLIAECRDALLRSWGQQPGLMEPARDEAERIATGFVAMMRVCAKPRSSIDIPDDKQTNAVADALVKHWDEEDPKQLPHWREQAQRESRQFVAMMRAYEAAKES